MFKKFHLMNLWNLYDCVLPFQAFAGALKENKTLKSLNMESNYISGESVVEILEAISENQTLVELRLANQVWLPIPPPNKKLGSFCLLFYVYNHVIFHLGHDMTPFFKYLCRAMHYWAPDPCRAVICQSGMEAIIIIKKRKRENIASIATDLKWGMLLLLADSLLFIHCHREF